MDEVLNQLTELEHVHEEFRLWVTTEVNVHFPITFLQMAIKFTNEPPQGVKASLKRTYSSFTQVVFHPVLFTRTVMEKRTDFANMLVFQFICCLS